MNRYPHNATTLKTLSQFTYDLYSAISVNMLKYNHDTSATLRLLSSLINTSREINEDLPYQINFNLKGLDFINIDRLNAFYWPQIKGFTIDEGGDTNCLFGYSRYTDKTYLMKRVEKQGDFIRHSMPADSFFSGAVFPGVSEVVLLSPYVMNKKTYEIKNTQITLYPYRGFDQFNLEGRDPAKVVVHGVDTRGNATSEEINFVVSMNYTTITEWKLITGMVLHGMAASASVIFYPYIAGDIALSSDLIITRQHLEPGPCILTVDKTRRDLVYNILRENYAEYPLKFDIVKTVPLGMKDDHTILSYYIDESNKLVYTIHGKKTLVPGETTTLPIPVFKQWKSWTDLGIDITISSGSWSDGWRNYDPPVFDGGDASSDVTLDINGGYILPQFMMITWDGNGTWSEDIEPTANVTFYLSDDSSSTLSDYASGTRIDFNTGMTGATLINIKLDFNAPGNYPGPLITDFKFLVPSIVGDDTRVLIGIDTDYAYLNSNTDSPNNQYSVMPGSLSEWANNTQGIVPICSNPGYTTQFITIATGEEKQMFGLYLDIKDSEGPSDLNGVVASDSPLTSLWDSIDLTIRNLPPVGETGAYVIPYYKIFGADGNPVVDWVKIPDNGVIPPFPPSFIGSIGLGWDIAELSSLTGYDMTIHNLQTKIRFSPIVTKLRLSYTYTPEIIATQDVTEYTEHTFSCYPLIIPTTPNNQLDLDRTSYQAVSVEYEEDCIAEAWDMWVFPTSKTNDVETMNITINGIEYISGMLLELIRYDIQTNRITIPFADIYKGGISSALVEIETYGAQRSYVAFTLDRTILAPLYDKDLDAYLKGFKKSPTDTINWSAPIVSSTNVPYKGGDLIGWGDGKYGGLTETLPEKPVGYGGAMDINYLDHYEMYRLSSTANVAVNGQKIVNIFDSFYADETAKYIVASDTITHIKGASCQGSPFTVTSQIPLDVLAANGQVSISFSAPVNPITLIAGNVNILGPAPWKYLRTTPLG